MSIETAIFDSLAALVGNRVFPDVAPYDSERPYITYQQIGGPATQCLDGTMLDKENCYVQINVWADTRLSATATAKAAESALVGMPGIQTKVLSNRINDHDEDLNRYGTKQDFSILVDR